MAASPSRHPSLMEIPLNGNSPQRKSPRLRGGILHNHLYNPLFVSSVSDPQPAFLTYSSRIFSTIAVAFSIACTGMNSKRPW